MNSFSNVVNHPKTSTAGLLIGVVSITSVLSQQGVTLGHVGSGDVLSMVAGVATVLLGLVAKDPGAVTAANTAQAGPAPRA
jgi:hypothetical protein